MWEYGVLLVNTNVLSHLIVSYCIVSGMYFCICSLHIKMQNNRDTMHVATFDSSFVVAYLMLSKPAYLLHVIKRAMWRNCEVLCYYLGLVIFFFFLFFSAETFRVDYNAMYQVRNTQQLLVLVLFWCVGCKIFCVSDSEEGWHCCLSFL
jgi:Ca2+/Na+ antiporter